MQLLKTFLLILISFFIGVFFGISIEKDSLKLKQIEKSTKTEQNSSNLNDEFTLQKGKLYVREMFSNKNDPFNKPVYDTVKVLDLQKSTSNDQIFVKWSTSRVKDTTVYFSTELNIFLIGIKELK